METETFFYITDWASDDNKFGAKTFKTWAGAESFLEEFLGADYTEGRQEYFICEHSASTEGEG